MSAELGVQLSDGMRLVSRRPLDAETSLVHHVGVLTPTPLFYHRNHFPFPARGPRTISIAGAVGKPFDLRADAILSMPSRTLLMTMECAGNGRSDLQPEVQGEPWAFGAVSTAEWTGVPLCDVLAEAGLQPGVREILFVGADHGYVQAAGTEIPFARSLPAEKAQDPDVILAFAMNGEPLGREHGGPLRLIVPGWYGVASVKWLARIEALREPFTGFYQADRYVMPDGCGGMRPLREMRVKSLIASPSDGARLERGLRLIRGMAWSGDGPITLVEVSVDAGDTWSPAHMASREERYAWRRWEYLWEARSNHSVVLLSRAVDAAGNSQPKAPEWNALGYANNAIQRVNVTVQ
jgi:DMSO/TMAO reductase YedYZ molybdopterin-dependent catalytic subunit